MKIPTVHFTARQLALLPQIAQAVGVALISLGIVSQEKWAAISGLVISLLTFFIAGQQGSANDANTAALQNAVGAVPDAKPGSQSIHAALDLAKAVTGKIPIVLGAMALLWLTGCANISDFWNRDSTQAAVKRALVVAETEAFNIGLNALSQYANGGGNINWANAAISAAPVALRTLESTPSASNESEISASVAASIAEWRLKRSVSAQTAAVVVKAISAGATPDQAVEAVASGLDAVYTTVPENPAP